MKVNTLALISCLLIAQTSCVDHRYDLAKLDKSITVLPGLEFPFEEKRILETSFSSLLDIPDDIYRLEDSTVVIASKISNSAIKTSFMELTSEFKTTFAQMETSFSEYGGLSKADISEALSYPAVIIVVDNPTDTVEFTASLVNGKKSMPISVEIPAYGTYSIYLSENGDCGHLSEISTNIIDIACNGLNDIFAGSIPSKLTLKNINLNRTLHLTPSFASEDTIQDQKADNNDMTFKISFAGIIPLRLQPGGTVSMSKRLDISHDIDLSDSGFSADDEFIIKLAVARKNIDFDICQNLFSTINDAFFTFDPDTLKHDNPNDVSLYMTFAKEPKKITSFLLSISAYNPFEFPLPITGKEALDISIKGISTKNGVNISF